MNLTLRKKLFFLSKPFKFTGMRILQIFFFIQMIRLVSGNQADGKMHPKCLPTKRASTSLHVVRSQTYIQGVQGSWKVRFWEDFLGLVGKV